VPVLSNFQFPTDGLYILKYITAEKSIAESS
jgi:hypothetical protein